MRQRFGLGKTLTLNTDLNFKMKNVVAPYGLKIKVFELLNKELVSPNKNEVKGDIKINLHDVFKIWVLFWKT